MRGEDKMLKKTWKICAVCMMLLLCMSGITVLASASDDNSLSDLGIENAVSVSPDFEYSTVEYEVVVPQGTEELILNPVPSNGAASFDVSGTALTDGETTVYITVTAESGNQAVYTLHVQAERPNAAEQIAAANETEAPETEPETQKKAETEEPETEPVTENASDAAGIVMEKVEKLKADTDFSMKVIYGLIALSVLLVFLVINLILKNRDLKDDLRDAEEKLELQTNEFARKERYLATDNYYAPTQQQAATGMQEPEQVTLQAAPQQAEEAPIVEEAFGAAKQPVSQKPEKQSTRRSKQREQKRAEKAAEKETKQEPEKISTQQMAPEKKKKDVDVTMIDL